MRYAVVIESGPENLSAYVPDLPGCIATGKTLDEVLANIRGATESISRGCAPMVCRYRNRLLAANTLKPLRLIDFLKAL